MVNFMCCQVCWNAAIVPMQYRRLWGGVQSVQFTNMSDAAVNSSLAQQSYTVRQLLMVRNLTSPSVSTDDLTYRFLRMSWHAPQKMHWQSPSARSIATCGSVCVSAVNWPSPSSDAM
jgi:hypothetical protein